jgi:hypothetical protein
VRRQEVITGNQWRGVSGLMTSNFGVKASSVLAALASLPSGFQLADNAVSHGKVERIARRRKIESTRSWAEYGNRLRHQPPTADLIDRQAHSWPCCRPPSLRPHHSGAAQPSAELPNLRPGPVARLARAPRGHVRGSGVRSGLRVILGWTLSVMAMMVLCGVRVGDVGQAAYGEDVQADVAAHLGPFVVLFGEHGADQADQGGPVGKDADDVGAAADLAVQSFLGLLDPDRSPDGFGEAGECQDVGPGGATSRPLKPF